MHDLKAVRAYLHRYEERAETQRAYKRELERLVFWCVAESGVALSLELWTRLRTALAERAALHGKDGERWRAARALLLIMGEGGLRIAEAAAGARTALAWLPAEGETPASWLLEAIGKGMKQRFVLVSDECVVVIRAHWADRDLDFDGADAAGPPGLPLIAPIVVPPTPRARAKSGSKNDDDAAAVTGGYSVRGARGFTQWIIDELLGSMSTLSEAERRKLKRTSPHALRHTVATQMLASGAAIEVVQQTLGQASLGTTAIYISPEQTRLRREAAKYHERLKQP